MRGDNILLTRIDNRLVHGQVGVTWTSTLNASVIVVVDEIVYGDKLQQKLMETIANTSNTRIRFFDVDSFVKSLSVSDPSTRIFLVIRNPQVLQQLVEKGVFIKSCNVGNMHYTKGKKPITKKIYIDEEDSKSFLYLLDNNVELFAQDVPGSLREELNYLSFNR